MRVEGRGFGVWVWGVGVWGLRFGVWSLGWGLGFRIHGSGFKGIRFRVEGCWCCWWCRIWRFGAGFRL